MSKLNFPYKKRRRFVYNKSNDFFIIDSLSAIKEYLKFKPQAILNLKYVQHKKSDVDKLLKDATNINFPVELINTPTKDGPTLYATIKVTPKYFDDMLNDIKTNNSINFILALDHIQDPANVGAIVRTAAFFNIKYVIVPSQRQATITQASVSTSMGGFALVDLVTVTNLVQTLEKLKESDFWILGADPNGEPCEKITGFYDKIVLVLGAEKEGLSALVKKKSDKLVKISTPYKTIDSLNVSVSAGILIYELKSKVDNLI